MRTDPQPLARQSPPPSPRGVSPETSKTRQSSTHKQSAEISFTTKEGDLVTLSSHQERAAQLTSQGGDHGNNSRFTAAILESDSFAVTVQGDLNPEELKDIKEFMVKLGEIASDFFSGDLGQALAGAHRLGPLGGSLSRLEAEFSRSSSRSSQSQLSSNHPLPARADLPAMDRELGALAAQQEELYKDTIQGRWRQIVEFLKQTQLRPAPATDPGEKRQTPPAASAPLARIVAEANSFLGNNPRLSPFLLPLAKRALEQSFAQLTPAERGAQRRPEDLLAALGGYLHG